MADFNAVAPRCLTSRRKWGMKRENVRATGRGGAAGGLLAVVIGGGGAGWVYGSQGAGPGDSPDVEEAPRHDVAEPVEGAASPRYGTAAGHRLRRRGWIIRRTLLLADAAGFLGALAVVDLLRADVDLSDPAVWLFGLGGFCAWVLFAHGY